MKGTMQGVTLVADWDPRPEFKLGAKDIERRQTYLGSRVWRNPRIEMRQYEIPTPGPDQVLLQVKACGICGSDVHMAQADKQGYTLYPGLTGFPCIMGHEISGIVAEAGKNARDKRKCDSSNLGYSIHPFIYSQNYVCSPLSERNLNLQVFKGFGNF